MQSGTGACRRGGGDGDRAGGLGAGAWYVSLEKGAVLPLFPETLPAGGEACWGDLRLLPDDRCAAVGDEFRNFNGAKSGQQFWPRGDGGVCGHREDRHLCLYAGAGIWQCLLHFYLAEFRCGTAGAGQGGNEKGNDGFRNFLRRDLGAGICIGKVSDVDFCGWRGGGDHQDRYAVSADRGCLLYRYWHFVPAVRVFQGREQTGRFPGADGDFSGDKGGTGVRIGGSPFDRRARDLVGDSHRMGAGGWDGSFADAAGQEKRIAYSLFGIVQPLEIVLLIAIYGEIELNSIKRLQFNEIQNCFSFWDFKDNLEKWKKLESEIIRNERWMYAYILNEEYVAGMSLAPLQNNAVYLSYLVVKEGYRNQGIGTQMIQYAFGISRNSGYSHITLNVDHNNPSAERLYEKLGFVAVETENSGKIKMRMEI